MGIFGRNPTKKLASELETTQMVIHFVESGTAQPGADHRSALEECGVAVHVAAKQMQERGHGTVAHEMIAASRITEPSGTVSEDWNRVVDSLIADLT